MKLSPFSALSPNAGPTRDFSSSTATSTKRSARLSKRRELRRRAWRSRLRNIGMCRSILRGCMPGRRSSGPHIPRLPARPPNLRNILAAARHAWAMSTLATWRRFWKENVSASRCANLRQPNTIARLIVCSHSSASPTSGDGACKPLAKGFRSKPALTPTGTSI